MAKITDHIKAFIVQRLAAFESPSAIAEAAKKEFGATVTRQHVDAYDPTSSAGRNVAEKWRTLFWEAREEVTKETKNIALAHSAIRIRALQEMVYEARKQGNMVLAAQLLEQIAKECGDAYSNRRKLEHTGKDGEPLPGPVNLSLKTFTDGELQTIIRGALQEV